MNRITGVAGVLAFAFISARAQAAEPVFATVSIKPSKIQGYGAVEFKPGGRLIAINVTVQQLVNAAYGSTSWRLSTNPNCPRWIASERFDVQAVAEEGAVPESISNARLRKTMEPMLQKLLADRFKLVMQRVPKDVPVFELTVAKSGPKLTEAAMSEVECQNSPDCHKISGNSLQGFRGPAASMTDLAFAIETGAGRPVVDATGIVGLFSIIVKPFVGLRDELLNEKLNDLMAAHPDAPRPPSGPQASLASILEKDLGLSIHTARARIETIQIDSVEKPSEN